MRIIGITGGIGSGKSRVLDFMEETYDAYIIKTDQVAHRLQEPGNECYAQIVASFGRSVLRTDDTLDRKKLGDLVFADEKKLQMLNRIVHPAVKAYVKEEIEKAKKEQRDLFLIESALLMEDHYEEICDELWFVFSKKEVRIQRLQENRKLTEEKINQIMLSQAGEEVYRCYCDRIIDNSGDFSRTKEQVAQALKETDGR